MARKQTIKKGETAAFVISLRTMQHLAALLFFVGVSGLTYATLVWVAAHPAFLIKSLQIRGDTSHLTEAIVRTAVVKQMRGTLFTANLAEVKRLSETMPWVRRAQVSRSWPNTIVLTIEEHRAFARLNDDQLINTFGEPFIVNTADIDKAQKLPLFQGRRETAALMRTRYEDLSAWLQPIGSAARKLSLSDRLSWTVVLENGLLIELGRDVTPDLVRDRVQRLTSTWPQLSQRVGVPNKIDLRYADGYAVQAPGLRIATPENKKVGI